MTKTLTVPKKLKAHDKDRDWQVFDPMKTKLPGSRDYYFEGKPYQEYVDSLEWLKGPKVDCPAKVRDGGTRIGDYWFAHANFPLYALGTTFMLGPMRVKRSGLAIGPRKSDYVDDAPKAYFDTAVSIPVLCTQSTTWMSITPMEMFTQRPGLRYAHGRTLIGGLGLGWFAHYCCLRKQTKEVVVIEQDQALIDHFGPKLKAMHAKLEIVQGDAYEFLYENQETFDSVLFDIWASLDASDWDEKWLDYLKQRPEKQRWWGWGTPRYRGDLR